MDSSLDMAVVRRFSGYISWSLLTIMLFACSTVMGAEPLRLVTGEQYPPFTGSDLHEGGVLTALVNRAFAHSRISTEIDFKPWVRGYEDSLKLEYGATFPYISTAEREASFLFSEPLYLLKMRLYVKPESAWREGSPSELQNAVFCLPVGYEFAGWASAQRDELTFVRPRTIEQCHKMLIRDRVDVLISNPANVAFLASVAGSKVRPLLLRQLPAPLADVTLHLMVPAHHPQATDLIGKFNSGLQHLRDTGEIERIFAAHPDYQATHPSSAR